MFLNTTIVSSLYSVGGLDLLPIGIQSVVIVYDWWQDLELHTQPDGITLSYH